MYISVKYDSTGIFRFDAMKDEPKLYRKYQAYIIGTAPNTTVQLHFEGNICSPLIVEVSMRIRCTRFIVKFSKFDFFVSDVRFYIIYTPVSN